MKKYAIIMFSACFIAMLQSCDVNINAFGTWKNDKINKDTRNEIDALNKKLFKSIMMQNGSGVKQLMSKVLLDKSGKKIDTLVNSFGSLFKATSYRVLDDFYTQNTSENTNTLVQSDRKDFNDYKIEYVAINKESYVSVMVSTNLPVNCMILAIYGKYGNEWKLNILRMGEYAVMDQTAPEYYNSALNHYTKGNTVDAIDMIIMASEIAHPADKYFSYLNEYEMKDTYSVIMKDANAKYHFPFIVNGVKTKPQIFAISPQLIIDDEPKGIYPLIKYQTSIKLTDTAALKAENKNIQNVINDVFTGIAKNKSGIIYRAYNQLPDGKTVIKHYTFLQKVKFGK